MEKWVQEQEEELTAVWTDFNERLKLFNAREDRINEKEREAKERRATEKRKNEKMERQVQDEMAKVQREAAAVSESKAEQQREIERLRTLLGDACNNARDAWQLCNVMEGFASGYMGVVRDLRDDLRAFRQEDIGK